MNPGEVTTVIMKFDLPKVPFKVPSSPRELRDQGASMCGTAISWSMKSTT